MSARRLSHGTTFALAGALALLTATAAPAAPAATAPGDLDPTFDGDGRVTKDFGGNFDGATGVAVQEDGKIVVVGSALDWDYQALCESANVQVASERNRES